MTQLNQQRTSKLPAADFSISLHSSDDSCSESRGRNTKRQRCVTDPSRYIKVVKQTTAKEISSSSEESSKSAVVEGRRAEGSGLIRGCDESSKSTVVDSPSDE